MPLTDNLVLITLGALILLLLLVLGFVLYLATRPEPEPGARVVAPRMRPESLRSSFRQAVELIEGHIASRKQRYDVPWVLVFDDGGAPLGLDQAGIASTLGISSTKVWRSSSTAPAWATRRRVRKRPSAALMNSSACAGTTGRSGLSTAWC